MHGYMSVGMIISRPFGKIDNYKSTYVISICARDYYSASSHALSLCLRSLPFSLESSHRYNHWFPQNYHNSSLNMYFNQSFLIKPSILNSLALLSLRWPYRSSLFPRLASSFGDIPLPVLEMIHSHLCFP